MFSLNPMAFSFSPLAAQSGRNKLPATKFVLLTDSSRMPQTESLEAESSPLNPIASPFSPLTDQSERNILEGSCDWLPDTKSVFSLNPLACSFSPVAGNKSAKSDTLDGSPATTGKLTGTCIVFKLVYCRCSITVCGYDGLERFQESNGGI